MSDQSNIGWTDSTWNPWRGCSKVSAGCKNCYAEALVNGRMAVDFSQRVRAAKATFDAPLRWNKRPWVCDECGTPSLQPSCGSMGCYCGTGWHPRRVFLGSLMDWLDLDTEVPIEWLAAAIDIVRRCPDLTFQCVTKRPELFFERMTDIADSDLNGFIPGYAYLWAMGQPPSNVHVIVSVEDQKSANERIPNLFRIPAAVRGLSVEPLLEQIDIRRWLVQDYDEPNVSWCIIGGESGPNRRDCGVDAIVDVARQCQTAGVPCFVKQDCAARPGQQGRIPDEVWALKQFPQEKRVPV